MYRTPTLASLPVISVKRQNDIYVIQGHFQTTSHVHRVHPTLFHPDAVERPGHYLHAMDGSSIRLALLRTPFANDATGGVAIHCRDGRVTEIARDK